MAAFPHQAAQADTAPPLAGAKVLDLGTRVAGPYCATLLGEFGAEVIKVELPGRGDPYRTVGTMTEEGATLNYLNDNRNKKALTLDLRQPAGVAVFKRLVADADFLVENFRPGTLEKWGLAPDVLQAVNPRLIVVRVSTYGQDGPYSARPGVARIAYGYCGISYLCGEADGPPLQPATNALGDYIAGQNAAFGALLAYIARGRHGKGQTVDVSLYESMLRMLDELVPAYARTGYVRERAGASSPHTVPSNHYRTRDGKWVAMSASSREMFQRLAAAMGQPAMAAQYPTNASRVAERERIEAAVSAWLGGLSRDEAIAAGEAHGVPIGPINSIGDLFEDAHIRARGSLRAVATPAGGTVTVVDTMPRLALNPGRIDSLGARLGEHTDAVLRDAGFSCDDIAELRAAGVV